ncbi:hypothetical protein U8L64_00285, partial [Pseudomonas sp. FIP_A4]
MLPLFCSVACLGCLLPNATACAMADQRANAGSASALLGSLQFAIAAGAAAAGGGGPGGAAGARAAGIHQCGRGGAGAPQPARGEARAHRPRRAVLPRPPGGGPRRGDGELQAAEQRRGATGVGTLIGHRACGGVGQ